MILANSLFGVMMTRVERFKNYKIVTTEDQVDKKTNKPNYISRNTINENLAILEMEKLCVVYSYPILIRSTILQNSKVQMYNYLNVGGELLLGGAYSDSVFKANSDFFDLYTSIKRRL